MKLLVCAFILSVTVSCTNRLEKQNQLIYSVLDSITGDKISDSLQTIIRHDNLKKIVGISAKGLDIESNLYTVKPLNDKFYLLQPKKHFKYARYFNAILKIENDKIINYFLLNDFSIKDTRENANGFLLLCSDWDNANVYWKSKHQILILNLDSSFKETWRYQVHNANYPIEAETIENRNDSNHFILRVITGCHICYYSIKLQLDENGFFKSLKEVKQHNSRLVDPETLNALFNAPANTTYPEND
jgi:hypothetical protein